MYCENCQSSDCKCPEILLSDCDPVTGQEYGTGA